MFAFKHVAQTQDLAAWAATAKCPACVKDSRIFAIVGYSEDIQKPNTTIYVDPVAVDRIAVTGIELAPQGLREAYQDALDTFNSTAPATAVLNQCRQALEAITQAALPEDKQRGSLANNLRALPTNVDLSRPLLDIADALRHAGNMGSHYRAGRKVPNEFRIEMMDMLDQLLEYLFIIPQQTSDTKRRITDIDNGAQAQTAAPPQDDIVDSPQS